MDCLLTFIEILSQITTAIASIIIAIIAYHGFEKWKLEIQYSHFIKTVDELLKNLNQYNKQVSSMIGFWMILEDKIIFAEEKKYTDKVISVSKQQHNNETIFNNINSIDRLLENIQTNEDIIKIQNKDMHKTLEPDFNKIIETHNKLTGAINLLYTAKSYYTENPKAKSVLESLKNIKSKELEREIRVIMKNLKSKIANIYEEKFKSNN